MEFSDFSQFQSKNKLFTQKFKLQGPKTYKERMRIAIQTWESLRIFLRIRKADVEIYKRI
jgi:hypothetical protein